METPIILPWYALQRVLLLLFSPSLRAPQANLALDCCQDSATDCRVFDRASIVIVGCCTCQLLEQL